MKARLYVCLLLLLACGLAEIRALDAAPRNYASEMAVNADVQADFFKRYPDLQDERDLVAVAARALAAEGGESRSDARTAELLARRTRLLLDQRTPQEWQRKAVSLFPELGVAGSEFNKLFLRHFKSLQETSPQFMEEPSWPVLLARRCADELRPKASVAKATEPSKNQGAPLGETTPAVAPAAKRTSWWAASLSFLLLVAVIVQPARWLWKCRRAFAGSGEPLTLWQRAMGPAAWAYLCVALIGLTRTFLANADQRLFDRSGIALLVGVVAGVVVALPAYGVALGSFWWWRQRHRTPPAPGPADRGVPETAALSTGGRKS